MQALEFVLTWRIFAANVLRHVHDGGHGVCVVRGKLGVHRMGRGQQLLGAGQVRHIGVVFARVDRVVALAVQLGAFDLAVPISALDQTHHQAVPCAACQIDDKVDHIGATLLVGLDHKADAVPALQAGRVAQRFEQVERQVEPVHLFGIDVQTDVVVTGQFGQLQHTRQQFIHHALVLGAAVAWVQGRQLDRDARAVHKALPVRCFADGVDGVFIRAQIALRVCFGQGGFAQHVVRIAKALRLHVVGTVQGLLNRLARHKLLAQHLHGQLHALADQRLAAFAHQPRERGQHRPLAVRGHQFAGEQQAPRSGVDKQRRAAAHMLVPVASANLVADQRVARGRVGDAQQRFGQTHQGHAFFTRQGVFLHQALYAAGTAAQCIAGTATQLRAFAQALHQLTGQRVGALDLRCGHAGRCQQRGQGLCFGQARGVGNGLAQCAALERRATGTEVGACGQSGGGDGGVHVASLTDMNRHHPD